MRSPRQRHATITSLMLIAGSAFAVDGASTYTARVIGGAWFAELGGDFTYDGEVFPGQTYSFEGFGLDEYEASPMLEVGINLPILFDLHAGYYAFGAEGSTNLVDPGFINDIPIAGQASMDVELTDVYAEVMWRVLNLDLGGAGIGLAVHYVDASVDVDSDLGQEGGEESFPIPAISARAFLNPWGGFSLEGKLHVMALELDDVEAEFVDFHALVGYRPIEWIGIEAGYRLVSYDFDVSFDGDEQLHLDMGFSGPFAGVRVQF